MSPLSPRTPRGDGAHSSQDALPGLAIRIGMPASPASDGFRTALKSLHAATANGGRFPLESNAEYRLRLRRAIADMTTVLDAASTPISTGRSFDHLLIEILGLHPSALTPTDRSRLLNAIAPLQAELATAVDFDATRVLLESTPAGPSLAALVFDTEPVLLDPDSQLSYVHACERMANATHARRDAGILAFAGSNPVRTVYWVDGDDRSLTDVRALELQTALHWNTAYTHQRIDTARALQSLPDTRAIYERGLASTRTVDTIAEGSTTLTGPLDQALDVVVAGTTDADQSTGLRELRSCMLNVYDAKVAAFATEHNPLHLAGKIRSTLAQLDPEGAAARRAISVRAQSNVEYRTLADGLAQVIATMAAEQALACMRHLEAMARDARSSDLAEPIGVRRASAFVSLLTRMPRSRAIATTASDAIAHADAQIAMPRREALEPVSSPYARSETTDVPSDATRSTVGAHLDVVMDLNTFLGLAETPADVVGAGPVPAHAARQFLADAAHVRIRRVLTDPRTGHRLDTGVTRYVLTELEQDLIFSRDQRCRFPDCRRRAIDCECDHALPYDHGGRSSTANLGALCKLHHQHKTHAGWQITTSNADGSCTWASPLGRVYQHESTPVLPWTIDDLQFLHDVAEQAPAPDRSAHHTDVVDPEEQPPF